LSLLKGDIGSYCWLILDLDSLNSMVEGLRKEMNTKFVSHKDLQNLQERLEKVEKEG
jgi:hypothetical protein